MHTTQMRVVRLKQLQLTVELKVQVAYQRMQEHTMLRQL